jgi:hypothetical protein
MDLILHVSLETTLKLWSGIHTNDECINSCKNYTNVNLFHTPWQCTHVEAESLSHEVRDLEMHIFGVNLRYRRYNIHSL